MTNLRLATAADDDTVRALLRDNGMPGWVDMAIAREPSYAAGLHAFGHDWAVLAQDGGATVGMYGASVLPSWVNGAVAQLGYLGGLRVQPEHRQRIRHLREGYASIRPLAPVPVDLPWWFTVVASDNTVARRLLESGLRGLPRYRPIGRVETWAMSAARGRSRGLWDVLQPHELPAALAWQRPLAAGLQLAPALDEARLRRIGIEHIRVCREAGAYAGMAVLWNQSAWKQVIARRYRGVLQLLRPAYNLWARLTRRVALPAPGQALGQTFIAFLTLAPQVLADRRRAQALMADLLGHCRTPVAALGLHETHPLRPVLAGFAPMRYAAQVYAVEFDGPAPLDGRPVQPEAALL